MRLPRPGNAIAKGRQCDCQGPAMRLPRAGNAIAKGRHSMYPRPALDVPAAGTRCTRGWHSMYPRPALDVPAAGTCSFVRSIFVDFKFGHLQTSWDLYKSSSPFFRVTNQTHSKKQYRIRPRKGDSKDSRPSWDHNLGDCLYCEGQNANASRTRRGGGRRRQRRYLRRGRSSHRWRRAARGW